MKKRLLILTLVLIPIVLIIMFVSRKKSGADSVDIKVYSLKMSVEGKRLLGGAPDFKILETPETQTFRLAGEVQVRKSRSQDVRRLRLKMLQGEALLMENANPSVELAEAIKKLFSAGIEADIKEDGSIGTLRLPEGTSPNLSTLAWKVLDVFAVSPRGSGTSLSRVENRMGGTMNVEYQWTDAGSLQRSVLELFSLAPHHDQAFLSEVVSSKGRCDYPDSEDKLPEQCKVTLETKDQYIGKTLSQNLESIELMRVQSSAASASSQDAPVTSYEVSLDPKDQRKALKFDLAKNTLGQETLPSLLTFLKDKDLDKGDASPGEISVWSEKMRALLIVQPSKAREFAQTITDFQPHTRAFALIPHILAVAGTPESQNELVQLLDQYSDQKQAKWNILTQFGQIDEPTVETLQFVSSWVDKEQDADYRDMTVLALGSLAGARQDESVAQDVLSKIADQIQNTTQEDELKILLGSLGNAGWVGSLDIARKFLASSSETMRIEAVQMIRFVRTEEALRLIQETAEKDSSVNVREKAVRMLRFQRPSPAATEFACALYTREPSVSVRYVHLENLIGWKMQSPCVAATINQAAQTETDPDLLKYLNLLRRQL
jgi:hypothetical protein